jgi:hypothetical protein
VSGYLGSDAVSQVRNILESGDGDAPAPDKSQVVEPPAEAQAEVSEAVDAAPSSSPQHTTEPDAEVVKDEAPTEVVEARDDGASSAGDPGDSESSSLHRVPYARFKEVVDARNGYKGEVDTLRKQVEELSSLMQRARQAQNTPPARQAQEYDYFGDDDMANLFEEEPDAYEEPWQAAMTQMQQRMHQYEVANATHSLEKEIASATEKFPVVPREALLQAVINDDSANLMEIAEQYSSFIATVEEAAIERHLAQGKSPAQATRDAKEEVAEAVAPRPSKAASAPVNPPISAGDSKPRTLKDASRALKEFLGNSNPFA